MQYLDALQLIRKHYNTIEFTKNIEIIKINKLLDFSNFYFIAVLEENGKAILSDMGRTGDLIKLPEEAWTILAKKYNLEYKNYTLSTEIKDIKNLYNFILLLDEVSKDN